MSGNKLPIHSERHMRIVCIGFGASGLCFAYKLQRSFSNFSLTVFEKNPEVSGTWYENRYPGVACDVQAHNYTWSFAPKHDWSRVYAPAQEIYSYFNDFMATHGLDKYCKTSHKVVGATWDDQKGIWKLQVEDLAHKRIEYHECDILINASGILNNWRWPAIPGLEKYKGTLVHSANWDESLDLTGKHVGLIGNGSSGIQILPAIQPIVDQLTTFIREPTWISPPFGTEQRIYTEEEKERFKNDPEVLTLLRKANETNNNSMLGIYFPDHELQKKTRADFDRQMREKLKDVPWLQEKLIPTWGVGCRRLTPGINYLETLSKPNVKVVYGEIESITEKGCKCDDGIEYPVDVLICATGFDTTFKPRFPLHGLEGKNLQDEWALEPRSYLGLAAPYMPNYFQFLGPHCPIGSGPVLIAIEAQADYMLSFCDRWQTENIHSMSPKNEAVTDFLEHCQEFMQHTVWIEECRSWYKSGSAAGRVSALWPGSTLHYLEALKEPRGDDWEIKYSGNRFSWLGNGFSQTELDEEADLGYYIRSHDDSPYASRRKRREVITHTGFNARALQANGDVNAGKDLLTTVEEYVRDREAGQPHL
ncbi:putative sterigmatocystin biosynthesis monooxygenase stcW [Fonsecaea pedrosoi]|nr:putative sterigmatocystin biosynthesis monooxygenase stcW [Fonsecaea pedrosoi]